MGTVERTEADFSFNLVLTGQREKSVDFGLPYSGDLASQYRVQLFKTSVILGLCPPTDDPLTFCISAPLEVASWESIFRPFPSIQLWILVIITFISLGEKQDLIYQVDISPVIHQSCLF